MKKAKIEKVINNVNDYLKKRNFEVGAAGQSKASFSEHDAGIFGIISPSTPTSFSYSTVTLHHSHVDQQYTRLRTWLMAEASEPCRTELAQVLFPLFVYLYLELVSSSGRQAANNFFKRHWQMFRANRDYDHQLQQIITAAIDLNGSPIIQNLKNGKYVVHLSEATLSYFIRYLKMSKSPSLLHVFNSYIEVEVDDSSTSGMHSNVISACSEDLSGHKHYDCTVDELNSVKKVINSVKYAVPLVPSACTYNMFNAFSGITCAKVNDGCKYLSAGFEDSSLKVWKLANSDLVNDSMLCTLEGSFNNCVLSCDEYNASQKSDLIASDDSDSKAVLKRPLGYGDLLTLRGHMGPVMDIAFTHDSSFMFSVSEDTYMRLWNLTDGIPVALYSGHTYPIWCIDVSPSTLYIFTGSFDSTACLWSTEYLHPLRIMAGHTKSVDCVNFHPNCSYVATGSSDRSVRLWQITDGSVARIFLQHKSAVNAVSFSPNGRYLASGSEDEVVLIWDLAAGKVLCEISPDANLNKNYSAISSSIKSLCWSRDSSVLFTSLSSCWVKAHHFKKSAVEEDSWDVCELDKIYCCKSTSSGDSGMHNGRGSLLHTSLTSSNYLAVVIGVNAETKI